MVADSEVLRVEAQWQSGKGESRSLAAIHIETTLAGKVGEGSLQASLPRELAPANLQRQGDRYRPGLFGRESAVVPNVFEA